MSIDHAQRQPAPGRATWFARFPVWALDAVAILVVLVTSSFGVPMMLDGGNPGGPGFGRPGGPIPGAQPVAQVLAPILIVLAACALVPLRRRWPFAVVCASMVLTCLSVALRAPSMGVGIVVILAMYQFGATRTRRATLIVGASATLIVVALSLLSSEFGVFDVRVFQIAAGIAVAAALGDSSRSKREAALAATERADRAERTREVEAQRRVAEERLRIAQDLHDTVAHQISVISLNAGVASSAIDANPEKARTALGTIRRSAREVLSEISELLTYLRTDDESGALPPQPAARDVIALIDRVREAGLRVTLTGEEALPEVGGAAGRVLYRVVQEGLTNAHKHGTGGTAAVGIEVHRGEVVVRISNPISGAAPQHTEPQRSGLGLTGIRERVAAIGGSVRITEGGEYLVEARLPMKREEQP